MFRGKSIYKNDSVLTIVENPRVAAYRDDRISDRSEVVVLLLTCVAKVASVGLIHPVTMSPTPSWDDSYSSLVAYKRRHGHCNIKQRCKIYPKLARWVKTQRCLNRSGKLLPERKQKLSSLGFQWEVTRRDNNFSRTGIKLLGEFKRKHGVRWTPACYCMHAMVSNWAGGCKDSSEPRTRRRFSNYDAWVTGLCHHATPLQSITQSAKIDDAMSGTKNTTNCS